MRSRHGTYPVAESSWHPQWQVLIMPNKIICGWSSCQRYVDVLWFIFHVLQLLLITCTQPKLCCLSRSTMKHLQIPNWKSDLRNFVIVIGGACMFIGYIRHPNYIHYECRVDIHIQRDSPISFKHVSLCYLLFDPHRTSYQSNIGVWLRKRAT